MKEIIIEGEKIKDVTYITGIFSDLGQGEEEIAYDSSKEWVESYGYSIDSFRDWLREIIINNPEGVKIVWKNSQISRINILKDPENVKYVKEKYYDYFSVVVQCFLEFNFIDNDDNFKGIELRLE